MRSANLCLLLLLLSACVPLLAEEAADNGDNAWSAVGLSGRVAWTSTESGDADVVFIDLESGHRGVVFAHDGEDRAPALSPDGCAAALITDKFDQPEILLVHLEPDADNRCPVRLTETPEPERDLDWSTDGRRVYYSASGEPDHDAISLFIDPDSVLDDFLETVNSLYYTHVVTGETEPQSLEPGEYRHPRHIAGFGVVCVHRAWSGGAHAELALVHDALVTSRLETPGTEVTGPPRRYPDDTLLVPVRRGMDPWFVRYDPLREKVLAETPAPPGLLNPVPDPSDAESGWYLCQTGFDDDPSSELVFVHGLFGGGELELLPLTDNDHYDGEASWAVVLDPLEE